MLVELLELSRQVHFAGIKGWEDQRAEPAGGQGSWQYHADVWFAFIQRPRRKRFPRRLILWILPLVHRIAARISVII